MSQIIKNNLKSIESFSMFTPYGPSNDTCLGIENYEAARPNPPPPFIFSTSLGLLIFMFCTHVSLLPLMWKWRNQSRFYRIRPFFLTWFLQLNFFLFSTTSLLPGLTNDHVPCWLLVFGTTIPVAFITSLFGLRILTVYIETLYMQSARVHLNKQQHTLEDTATQSSYTSSSFCMKTTPVILRFIFRDNNPEHLLPHELAIIKRSNVFISISLSLFGWMIFLLLIFIIPPYRNNCTQCDLFTEIIIGILMVTFFGIIFTTRVVYITFKLLGTWDKKGVMLEMLCLCFISGIFFISCWILVLVDPGNLSYKKIMYWPWFQCVDAFIAWFFSCYLQVILQYRENNKREQSWNVKISRTSLSFRDSDCMEILKKDDGIKQEFETYAETHFILDSLLFLYAVDQFRTIFYDKNENMKEIVYKRIVDKYIREGADYEINISFLQRAAILKNSNINSKGFYTVFDDAYREVKKMIQQGGWVDFLRRRQEGNAIKQHRQEVSPYF